MTSDAMEASLERHDLIQIAVAPTLRFRKSRLLQKTQGSGFS